MEASSAGLLTARIRGPAIMRSACRWSFMLSTSRAPRKVYSMSVPSECDPFRLDRAISPVGGGAATESPRHSAASSASSFRVVSSCTAHASPLHPALLPAFTTPLAAFCCGVTGIGRQTLDTSCAVWHHGWYIQHTNYTILADACPSLSPNRSCRPNPSGESATDTGDTLVAAPEDARYPFKR